MIYDKVVAYCKEHNMSVMAFEQMCGLANGVVSKWESKVMPSLQSLKRVSAATGIPISEWIEAGCDQCQE